MAGVTDTTPRQPHRFSTEFINPTEEVVGDSVAEQKQSILGSSKSPS